MNKISSIEASRVDQNDNYWGIDTQHEQLAWKASLEAGEITVDQIADQILAVEMDDDEQVTVAVEVIVHHAGGTSQARAEA